MPKTQSTGSKIIQGPLELWFDNTNFLPQEGQYCKGRTWKYNRLNECKNHSWKKRGFSIDEERIETGIHNYSQHKKQHWHFDRSTKCGDLKRMAHEWKSALESHILRVTYQTVTCKRKWIYMFIYNDLHGIRTWDSQKCQYIRTPWQKIWISNKFITKYNLHFCLFINVKKN
jgi:hypothetical protein